MAREAMTRKTVLFRSACMVGWPFRAKMAHGRQGGWPGLAVGRSSMAIISAGHKEKVGRGEDHRGGGVRGRGTIEIRGNASITREGGQEESQQAIAQERGPS